MWNPFGKSRYSSLVRACDVCATPSGTKACDAVGGAFRPKWREGSPGEEEVTLKEKTSPSSWEANGGGVTNVWNGDENWIYWTGDNLPDGLIFLSIVPQSALQKLNFSILPTIFSQRDRRDRAHS